MTLTTMLLRWTARLLWTSIDEAINWDEIDVAARFDDDRLAEAIDWDEIALEEFVDPNEHFGEPIERLRELDDETGRIYVWECTTDEAAKQINGILASEAERKGRQFRATHIVTTDEEQLRELDPDDIRATVDPFDGGEA